MERVAVVGLGYVGSVTAASLAARGWNVVGIDRRAAVTEAMARGVAPIPEPGLEERLARAKSAGTLELTTDPAALATCTASLICVGTPVGADGQLVVDDLLAAIDTVAKHAPRDHVCIVRSTVPPGLYDRARRRLGRPDVGLVAAPVPSPRAASPMPPPKRTASATTRSPGSRALSFRSSTLPRAESCPA